MVRPRLNFAFALLTTLGWAGACGGVDDDAWDNDAGPDATSDLQADADGDDLNLNVGGNGGMGGLGGHAGESSGGGH